MPTALICGGSGALGGALVEAFRARGDSVVIADRTPPVDLREGVTGHAVDLTDPEAVEELWGKIATPEWVVNAVGAFRAGTVADTEADDYAFAFDVNLGATYWSCRSAARRLEPGAAIVNIASRSALTGGAGSAAYSVAKAGVVRLTEVLQAELAERRVRVNAVLPSVIDTPANRATESADRIAVAVDPGHIASVVAFLCSDAGRAVTGAIVPVYGWA